MEVDELPSAPDHLGVLHVLRKRCYSYDRWLRYLERRRVREEKGTLGDVARGTATAIFHPVFSSNVAGRKPRPQNPPPRRPKKEWLDEGEYDEGMAPGQRRLINGEMQEWDGGRWVVVDARPEPPMAIPAIRWAKLPEDRKIFEIERVERMVDRDLLTSEQAQAIFNSYREALEIPWDPKEYTDG